MLPDVTERLKAIRYDLAVTEKVLKDPKTEDDFVAQFAVYHSAAVAYVL